MALIKGVHHVCMKCVTSEQFDEVRKFYGEILGLPVVRSWAAGIMYDLGGSLLEVFSNGAEALPQGVWQHIALATDDVDACVKAVSKAGYAITIAPKDIVIASEPPLPARIAFCIGPMGEEIEFFQEK
ncbi:MAG: VOC family protein [Oscillospiraceae bacterium]|nr:VOC family protein [Oscillospiraceae bacterium]